MWNLPEAEMAQKAESAQKAGSSQKVKFSCMYMKSRRILYWKAEFAQKAEFGKKDAICSTTKKNT